MRLFGPDSRPNTVNQHRLHAAYELSFTVVDFVAALCFVVGSLLFFREQTVVIATWLFLIGSVCFALKPTIRVVREFHLLRQGDIDTLAERDGQ